MMIKLRHYYRRMRYLAWVEWLRIVKEDKSFDIPGIYLISQRELTKAEFDFPASSDFMNRIQESISDYENGNFDEFENGEEFYNALLER